MSKTTSGSIEQHDLIISEQRGTRFSLSLHPFSSPECLDGNKIMKVFQSFNVESKITCTRLEPRLFKQHVEEDKKRKTTEQSTSTPTNAAACSQDGSSSSGSSGGAAAQNLLICIPLDLKAKCKIQRSFLRSSHSSIKTSDIQMERPPRRNDSPQLIWGASQKYSRRKSSSFLCIMEFPP